MLVSTVVLIRLCYLNQRYYMSLLLHPFWTIPCYTVDRIDNTGILMFTEGVGDRKILSLYEVGWTLLMFILLAASSYGCLLFDHYDTQQPFRVVLLQYLYIFTMFQIVPCVTSFFLMPVIAFCNGYATFVDWGTMQQRTPFYITNWLTGRKYWRIWIL